VLNGSISHNKYGRRQQWSIQKTAWIFTGIRFDPGVGLHPGG